MFAYHHLPKRRVHRCALGVLRIEDHESHGGAFHVQQHPKVAGFVDCRWVQQPILPTPTNNQ